MTYSEAIHFLHELRMFGANFGLENTRRLAALAGNSQERLRFIHVAGTNGKGSTCAMLESIYRAAGLRVGLFTSPHLVSFCERIQINRQVISEADVVHLVEIVQPLLREFPATQHPTFFEVVTVMALRHFAEQKCDLVVLETGLGGRLDATNIVTPLASVITNIAFDHQQWLGDTLAKIAAEKAGIIKPGVPVITAAEAPEALAVIRETARSAGAPLTVVTPAEAENLFVEGVSILSDSLAGKKAGPPLTPTLPPPRGEGERRPVEQSFNRRPQERLTERISLPLPGAHQGLNAAVALAVVRALAGRFTVSDDAIWRGLEQVRWPGRFQVIERQGCIKPFILSPRGTSGERTEERGGQQERTSSPRPAPPSDGREGEIKEPDATRIEHGRQTFVLDGAHNPAGAAVLRTALAQYFPNRRPALIFGVLGDKDWPAMCATFAALAGRLLIVPVGSERTANPADLEAACRAANSSAPSASFNTLADALAAATGEELIVITGSLYLVGEALELLRAAPVDGPSERGLNERLQVGAMANSKPQKQDRT